MAPPFGFTLSSSSLTPRDLKLARPWAAKASLISIISIYVYFCLLIDFLPLFVHENVGLRLEMVDGHDERDGGFKK